MGTRLNDYASALGLEGQELGSRVIREAYHRLVLHLHPIRHRGQPTAEVAAEELVHVTEAYEFLSEVAEEAERLGLAVDDLSGEDHVLSHRYRKQPFIPGLPDGNVREVFVKSSHILSVGYSHDDRKLYVKLQGAEGTKTYCYHTVPEEVFVGLLSADSPGRYANVHIYRQFQAERC